MDYKNYIAQTLSETSLTDDKFVIFDIPEKTFVNILKEQFYYYYIKEEVSKIKDIKTYFDSKEDAEKFLNDEYVKKYVPIYSDQKIITLAEAKSIISGEKNPFELQFDIREHLKDIDTIKASEINGNIPSSAEYVRLNPSETSIESFYRTIFVSFNDGTNSCALQFFGEQGSWRNSSYNNSEFKRLKDDKKYFRKIIY